MAEETRISGPFILDKVYTWDGIQYGPGSVAVLPCGLAQELSRLGVIPALTSGQVSACAVPTAPTASAYGEQLLNAADAAEAQGLLSLGSMATQAANAVEITGGNADLTTLDVTGTTPSLSPSTGALTVAGGAGVVGDLNVGGDATVSGIFSPNIINGAYLASNNYARTGIALRVPNERLAPGALAYTVSGTATNPNNAFGGDYSDFVTFTDGETLEVDVRPLLGSNGFTSLAAGDIFALTFRGLGGAAPSSALIEVFDSTLTWFPVATISSFTVFGAQGWLGFYRHTGAQRTSIRQIRLTISTPGSSLLAGFEWFPARPPRTDMQQFIPSQANSPITALLASGLIVRPNSQSTTRVELSAGRLRSVTPSGIVDINNGQFVAASFTVAQLQGGITGQIAGSQTYCTNESGGAVPVFFDGANWRRVTDRAIIS